MFKTFIFMIILGTIGFIAECIRDYLKGDKETPQNDNAQEIQKYCSNCGFGLLNDEKFCSNCGFKIIK